MKAQARRGQVSPAPSRLLQLNDDVFKHIMDYISARDARALRLCSRQAAQVAAPRALSTRTLLMSEGIRAHVEGILQRIGAGNTPEFVCLADLTLISTYLPDWRASTIAFAPVLLRLLQKATGLQAFTCADYDVLLASAPLLQRSVSRLRSLQSLILSSCPAGTSDWLLGRANLREQGSLKSLVCLCVSQLDLPNVDQSSVAHFVHLRTLIVRSLNGQLALLVHLAPNLMHLEVESIERADEMPDTISRCWRSLDFVQGRLRHLYRLLPLFRKPMATRRVVFTDHVVEHGEHKVTDVLSATQPCCLEFRGQDYLPLPHLLPSVSQRLFYLEVCRPVDGGPWLNDLLAIAKELPCLLCLDLNVRRGDVPDDFPRFSHYFTCKIPGLRFVIVTKQTRSPLNSDRIEINWKHRDVYGIRLVHHELSLENWAQGRYCEALRLAHAQRLRAAYRDASFETRFDVEERLFPGPLPSGPGMGARGVKLTNLPWATMADDD